LRTLLSQQGIDLSTLPYVLQYNKMDLPDVHDLEQMQSLLNPSGVHAFDAIAMTGVGVLDSLRAIIKLKCVALARSLGAG
jgi:mutual gliding-motility protein MglA